MKNSFYFLVLLVGCNSPKTITFTCTEQNYNVLVKRHCDKKGYILYSAEQKNDSIHVILKK